MTATATVIAQVISNLTNTTSSELVTGESPVNQKKTITFTDGAGANKIEAIYHDQRTLSASATENLDLAGSLSDVFGNTITFTKIKYIYIFAAAANTNDVQFQCPASNGFINWCMAASDGIQVQPGGIFLLVTPSSGGYAVTASTGDLITMTNSAGSTSDTYDVIIAGETS